MEDPRLVLGGAQRVEVEDCLPIWLAADVIGPRCAPQEAATVFGIGPEVVDEVAMARGVGDAVVGLEYIKS